MLRRVAVVRIDVSEELNASFIRVTRIGELRTMLTLTSTLRRNVFRFLQERHGVTSQKTPFFSNHSFKIVEGEYLLPIHMMIGGRLLQQSAPFIVANYYRCKIVLT
jgi:hypothetical protein